MKVHTFTKEQFVPISMDVAWDFFSSPANLRKITPRYMDFEILSGIEGGKMYAGQIICYTVRPLLGIPMRWTTEITHVEEGKYFVDEQRFGPYAFWHHQHFFTPVDGGVMIKDVVHYAIPFWFLGDIANFLMVKSKLKEIFDFREQAVKQLLG